MPDGKHISCSFSKDKTASPQNSRFLSTSWTRFLWTPGSTQTQVETHAHLNHDWKKGKCIKVFKNNNVRYKNETKYIYLIPEMFERCISHSPIFFNSLSWALANHSEKWTSPKFRFLDGAQGHRCITLTSKDKWKERVKPILDCCTITHLLAAYDLTPTPITYYKKSTKIPPYLKDVISLEGSSFSWRKTMNFLHKHQN